MNLDLWSWYNCLNYLLSFNLITWTNWLFKCKYFLAILLEMDRKKPNIKKRKTNTMYYIVIIAVFYRRISEHGSFQTHTRTPIPSILLRQILFLHVIVWMQPEGSLLCTIIVIGAWRTVVFTDELLFEVSSRGKRIRCYFMSVRFMSTTVSRK